MELGQMIFGNKPAGFYEVERGKLQDVFHEYLREMGFDGYGYREGSEEFVFENDVFRLQPYWWGDCVCEHGEEDLHEDDCYEVTPNFTFKPTGFEMSWYKYPLRGAYATEPVTLRGLVKMMERCLESVRPATAEEGRHHDDD